VHVVLTKQTHRALCFAAGEFPSRFENLHSASVPEASFSDDLVFVMGERADRDGETIVFRSDNQWDGFQKSVFNYNATSGGSLPKGALHTTVDSHMDGDGWAWVTFKTVDAAACESTALVPTLMRKEQCGETRSAYGRTFASGACRDSDEGKLDYEACLSPIVLDAFSEYMLAHNKNRTMDNWQKGMPRKAYIKSLLRHTFDVWKIMRGIVVLDRKTKKRVTLIDALCACFFNVQGLMLEIILDREVEPEGEVKSERK